MKAMVSVFCISSSFGDTREFKSFTEDGSCRVYPETGYLCSDTLGGINVYEFYGTDFEVESGIIEEDITPSLNGISTLTSAECIHAITAGVCLSAFPPCDEKNLPRKPCRSFCEELHLETLCGPLYQLVRTAGLEHLITECDDLIGTEKSRLSNMFVLFQEGWRGEPVYETDIYFEDAFSIGPTTMQCVNLKPNSQTICEPQNCGLPTLERRWPKLKNAATGSIEFKNPPDFEFCMESLDLNCSKCFSSCVLPCPLPAYSIMEFRAIWLTNWLPGILSLPLSVFIFCTERRRLRFLRRRRHVVDHLVSISAALCIVFVLIDSLPSLVLREDMRCAGFDHFAPFSNAYGSHFCRLGKIKPNVLQSLLGTLVICLFRVRKQLKYPFATIPTSENLYAIIVVFILPSISAVLAFALESDQLFESHLQYRVVHGGEIQGEFLFVPNNLRYQFTCGPKLSSVAEEFVVVRMLTQIYGFVALALALSLLLLVRNLTSSKLGNKENQVILQLGIATARFAVVCLLLLAINVVAEVLFLPHALEFGKQLTDWTTCIVTGVNLELAGENAMSMEYINFNKTLEAGQNHCGKLEDLAPPSFQIMLLTLSQSLTPLAFGFIFSFNAQKTRQRLLRRQKRNRIVPKTTTKNMSEDH